MSRSRKEDDKCPWWSWVTNCNPLEVTEDNVNAAYRINIPRCEAKAHSRNCKGNPFCLSKLGEDKWSKEHKDSNCSQFDDPERERRKPGTYVGLKNLGATCYVNSLLQLWFHNPNFQRAIFKWRPSNESVSDDCGNQSSIADQDENLVYNLQKVFALMKSGNKRFVDPTDFITSLRLDISVQQDAQEFSKLFLSKLETVLSYQSEKEVRDLIKDNFCGEYLYVTRCTKCLKESKCPSKFYELNLNVKGNKTIQDCLKEFLKKEILDGDNKYSCANCGDKQDAERFISVTELPPVLNLQLMRFYYDINTDQKRKLSTAIQFAEKLDMSELCENIGDGLEYTLSAVLYHGGNSANSGHYVAHICDSETGTWFKFNDESVEKIDNKKLKFTIEDEYEDAKKNKTQKNLPKGWYQSKSAYMLVYTRTEVDPASSEKTPSDCESTLPSHLESFVEQNNEQFENWIVETKISNEDSVEKGLTQYDEMVSCITMLPVDSDTEDFDAVPTSWLQQWLVKPEIDSKIDNRKFLCQHGKFDPNEVANVKYINSEIAETLFDRYSGGPRLRYCEFKCRACIMNKCFDMRLKSRILEEKKFITSKLKNMKDTETGFWVCKSSIRNWHSLARRIWENVPLSDKCLELLNNVNKDLKSAGKCENGDGTPCENGDLTAHESGDDAPRANGMVACQSRIVASSIVDHRSPRSAEDDASGSVPKAEPMEVSTDESPVAELPVNHVVPETSYNNVFQNFIRSQNEGPRVALDNIADDPNFTDGVCPEPASEYSKCVPSTMETLDDEPKAAKTKNNNQRNAQVVENGKNEFHSKPTKRKRDNDDDDSSSPETQFNEDLLCQHGFLSIEENKRRLVPDEVWRIFKKYFPFTKEFPSETPPCDVCKSLASEDEVAKDMYKDKAIKQKECLSELYSDRNRPQLGAEKNEPDTVFFVVNKEFISSWRKFIREAGKKEPPYSIQINSALLCSEHGGFLYDLSEEMPDTIVLTTNEEWKLLSDLYPTDIKIAVTMLEDGQVASEPAVCVPCMSVRMETELKARLCYTNAKIYIKLLNEEREETQPISTPNGTDEIVPPKRMKTNNHNGISGSLNGIQNSRGAYGDACTSNGDISVVEENCTSRLNGDVASHDDVVSTNGCASPDEVKASRLENGAPESASDDAMTLVMTCDEEPAKREAISDDESAGHSKLSNGDVNGKSSPTHSSNGKSSPTHSANGSAALESVPVRRSNRSRRGNKTVEITVSSSLTLKEVKKKIYEKMDVVTLDQHLINEKGIELSRDDSTLADLEIFPGATLHLKVDEPPRELSPEWQESTTSREVERGFSGTVLA